MNCSSGIDSVTLNRSLDPADVTTYGDNDHNYIPGLRNATLTIAGHFASTYEEKLSALLGWSTLPNWVFGPESTANTRRKVTAAGILTKFTIGDPVADKVSMSFDIQSSGLITATTF